MKVIATTKDGEKFTVAITPNTGQEEGKQEEMLK